jgi:ATP-dependent DNA helicase RecG
MRELDGGFLVTLFKTSSIAGEVDLSGLNERQLKTVAHVKTTGRITNKDYQEIFGVARVTATSDLAALVEKGFLKSSKSRGVGSYYEC